MSVVIYLQNALPDTNRKGIKGINSGFFFKIDKIAHCKSELFHLSIASFGHVILNKQVKSTCRLLSFSNMQLVIPGFNLDFAVERQNHA